MNFPFCLTVEAAGDYSGAGRDRIRDWAENDPTFPAFRNGVKILIPRPALETWLINRAQAREGFKTGREPDTITTILRGRRRREA